MSKIDELYVMARRVLLDALDALGTHREALILVGAQAVYLRVGEGDISVAPFTTDGDLAIDPSLLAEIPPLEQSLRNAGFLPKSSESVGIWNAARKTSQLMDISVAIDLLVPAAAQPGGRRSASLPGHDSKAVRIVKGLDGAMVDADVMQLTALEDGDARAFDLRVAGPAALLVAKMHKISERQEQKKARQSDKDALDVLRLLRGTETKDLAGRYSAMLGDSRSREASQRGLQLLEDQFAQRNGAGVAMAIRSAGQLADAEELAASCIALTSDLLAALK